MDYGRLFFDPPAPRCNMFFMGSNNTPSFPGARTLLSMEENPGSWKRPFFSSLPEEFIYEDEYYDDQTPAKKRRLTTFQVNLLEKSFEEENKLEPERKVELAKKLGLQPRQVAVWFQNRRARSKTKQLERDYDLLKASYDTLLSNYEAILKDNEDLKSQVISLTKKLQIKDEVLGPPSPRTSEPIQKEEELKEAQILAQQQLSSVSSTGALSGVVNEENPQLVVDDNNGDSSNFFESPLLNLVVPQDNVSKDDIDHTPYLPCMFTVDDHHKEQEKHDLGWWGWY